MYTCTSFSELVIYDNVLLKNCNFLIHTTSDIVPTVVLFANSDGISQFKEIV